MLTKTVKTGNEDIITEWNKKIKSKFTIVEKILWKKKLYNEGSEEYYSNVADKSGN